ncbi:hypothetical protein OU631_19770 [Escherichia coli]|nr:hypothetical protein [Escherichia coli]
MLCSECIARLEAEGWLTRKARRQGNDDLVKPVKEQAENKIDGAVALIMTIGRAMLKEPDDFLSSLDPDDDLLIL